MLDIWFGLDATGFQRSGIPLYILTKLLVGLLGMFLGDFHPIFGPVLMVTYACLSNTLLLTGVPCVCSNEG